MLLKNNTKTFPFHCLTQKYPIDTIHIHIIRIITISSNILSLVKKRWNVCLNRIKGFSQPWKSSLLTRNVDIVNLLIILHFYKTMSKKLTLPLIFSPLIYLFWCEDRHPQISFVPSGQKELCSCSAADEGPGGEIGGRGAGGARQWEKYGRDMDGRSNPQENWEMHDVGISQGCTGQSF